MKSLFKKIIYDRLYTSENLRIHRLAQRLIILNHNIRLGILTYKKIPTNTLKVHEDQDIPPLSWLCTVDHEGLTFSVGRMVERSGTRIVEGAWDGDFAEGRIEDSEFVYGSGATIKRGEVIFVPPKHGLESLYVLYDKTQKINYVSNSLCFVLSAARISSESKFFKNLSAVIHESSKKASELGVDKYNRVITEDELFTMRVMTYHNFSLSNNGSMKIYNRSSKKYFNNYHEYRDFLSHITKKIIRNATHKNRKHKYKPISAVSKGYDSPAVSVIAKDNASKEALTLNVTVYGFNDSGDEIGNAIGLNVHSFSHILTNTIEDLNIPFENNIKNKALEFIATYGIGDDVAFLSFEEKLKNRIYMSGTYGDVLWKKADRLTPGLTKLVFEKSMTEFRLRVGFINFPLISAGARFPAPIKRITNSDEMRKYSVGGKYDRPIPRRIVEEAGVPRNYFGVQKSASSPLILNHKELFSEAVENIMERYKSASIQTIDYPKPVK